MKLKNAKISILINRDYTTIELIDSDSSTTFATAILTPEQLSSALSRMVYTDCNIEVSELGRVGKKMEHKYLEFPINAQGIYGNDRVKIASETSKQFIPEGWISDDYYSSQQSFFTKDNQQYARVIIRRYI